MAGKNRFGNSCFRAWISENGGQGNIVMGLLLQKKTWKPLGTGWSINNRTILNCSHFFRQAIFFQSVFTQGKYTHWQIITATLVRHGIICYSGLVSHCFTLQLGGSANSILWRGRHFWKIARVNAHWIFASYYLHYRIRLEQKEALSIAISKPGALLGLGALLDRQFQYSPFFTRCHGRRPAGRASLQNHSFFLSKCLDPSGHEVLG